MRSAAVLLDLDGTLVDSRVVIGRHWGMFAERHGIELSSILAVCHGRRSADTIAEIAPHLDPAAESAVLDAGEETDVDGLVTGGPVSGAAVEHAPTSPSAARATSALDPCMNDGNSHPWSERFRGGGNREP